MKPTKKPTATKPAKTMNLHEAADFYGWGYNQTRDAAHLEQIPVIWTGKDWKTPRIPILAAKRQLAGKWTPPPPGERGVRG